MNKKQQISFIKKEIAALEDAELVLKQSLAVITSCKERLKVELEELGASSSTRKGKYNSLSAAKKMELIGSLTKTQNHQ